MGVDHNKVQETETGIGYGLCPPFLPLPSITPHVPTQYTPAEEASALDDTSIPGGYLQ